ncbi:MAG: hypothetical protein WAX38_03430 [Minisyncoccia bacterium]
MRNVYSSDLLQPGYTYELVSQEGTHFSPSFKPQLTPQMMLEMGVFGGNYFEGCIDEYPQEWFKNAKILLSIFEPRFLGEKANSKRDHIRFGRGYDELLNYFQVDASQSREEWVRKGWIHPDDPRGWFQWYCRYYMGRRHEDDARQIERWRKMARHIVWLHGACSVGDLHCRPRQRQALLHWAYDSTKL